SPGAGYPGRPRTQQLYRTGECLCSRASWPEGCLPGTEPCSEVPALPLPAHRARTPLMSRPAPRRPADWQQYMASRAAAARHPGLRNFYRADWPDADTPLAQLAFAGLDLETTGLDPPQQAIVSIGLIPVALERILADRAWYQLIRPEGDLTAQSVTLHQITHADIQRAPRFEEVLQDLLQRL